MSFPSLEEVIACNEAVRGPDEISPSADDDDLDRVARALDRARIESDPIDTAAALAFELTSAQAFHEGNKRTAAVMARWFSRTNTDIDPDRIIKPDDPKFADLLIAAARGDDVGAEIRGLFHSRAETHGGSDAEARRSLDALTAEAQDLGFYDE
ncbi:MAG: Fic family protein [Acidimicrobiia bacterium]